MPDYFYLTQKDRDLLDKLATIFKGHVTPNRQSNPEDAIPKSPDVYIALVPAGGIPAAQNNAEDDEPELVEGDRPGSAECDIYRVINGELKFAGSKQKVFNITSSVVEEGWIAVQKDKYGTWLADVGGASDGAIIHFRITDILRGDGFLCNAVEAEVMNIACGSPPVSVGDVVEVWDSLGCTFNCPMILLIGVEGYAIRMKTPDVYSELADQFGDGGFQPETPCRWEVDRLCCVEGE